MFIFGMHVSISVPQIIHAMYMVLKLISKLVHWKFRKIKAEWL